MILAFFQLNQIIQLTGTGYSFLPHSDARDPATEAKVAPVD
jgi:hypothetical protein